MHADAHGYKELERMLKVSEIRMSVDKVLALAKTITTNKLNYL